MPGSHQTSLYLLVGGSEGTASLRAEIRALAGFRALARARFGWRGVYGAGVGDGADTGGGAK